MVSLTAVTGPLVADRGVAHWQLGRWQWGGGDVIRRSRSVRETIRRRPQHGGCHLETSNNQAVWTERAAHPAVL